MLNAVVTLSRLPGGLGAALLRGGGGGAGLPSGGGGGGAGPANFPADQRTSEQGRDFLIELDADLLRERKSNCVARLD